MNKYPKRKPVEEVIKTEAEIYQGETDKIIYINKKLKSKKMIEIITVAYVSYIKGEWVTIVRYDNDPSHGVNLHVHITESYQERTDAATSAGVRQRGTVHRLHTWAVENLKDSWIYYKRAFLRRSKLRISEI